MAHWRFWQKEIGGAKGLTTAVKPGNNTPQPPYRVLCHSAGLKAVCRVPRCSRFVVARLLFVPWKQELARLAASFLFVFVILAQREHFVPRHVRS